MVSIQKFNSFILCPQKQTFVFLIKYTFIQKDCSPQNLKMVSGFIKRCFFAYYFSFAFPFENYLKSIKKAFYTKEMGEKCFPFGSSIVLHRSVIIVPQKQTFVFFLMNLFFIQKGAYRSPEEEVRPPPLKSEGGSSSKSSVKTKPNFFLTQIW